MVLVQPLERLRNGVSVSYYDRSWDVGSFCVLDKVAWVALDIILSAPVLSEPFSFWLVWGLYWSGLGLAILAFWDEGLTIFNSLEKSISSLWSWSAPRCWWSPWPGCCTAPGPAPGSAGRCRWWCGSLCPWRTSSPPSASSSATPAEQRSVQN